LHALGLCDLGMRGDVFENFKYDAAATAAIRCL